MKTFLVALGILYSFTALAASGVSVGISPYEQIVEQGRTPHFIVALKAGSIPLKLLKFDVRQDLKDSFVRLVVSQNGAQVDVPSAISDPGPIEDNDYFELAPGQTFTLTHDGFPLALSSLSPGVYSVFVKFRPDWQTEPVNSEVVSFRVVAHGS